MRLERFLPVLVGSVVVLAACGLDSDWSPQGRSPDTGGVAFEMDFAALSASAPTITGATATLTRDGSIPITKALTVASDVATGQVDGLAPGYWRVEVEAYDGATLIYEGAADVNVIAGVTVQCNILFDPVVVAPTTGSVAITVGLNPMPGYSAVNQTVTEILFDRGGRKLYVLDGPAQIIGVYDADTLVRTKDLALPSAPLSVELTRDGTGIYLGYASGHIRLLDVGTGEVTLVADVLMQVQRMASLGGSLLMAGGPASSYDAQLKVVNVATGQVVSTRSIWYSLTELVYNAAAKTVYSHHQGVSPTDIQYLKLDDAGAIVSNGDSIYHGDYALGRPLRIINQGTRLATASGNMFSSAELVASDLRYSGNLGQSYVDLSADDELGKLYVLNASGLRKLLVIDQETYFVDLTVDLPGTPVRVFDTASSVVVFSTKDARTYAKSFAKADLGL
jgi:hypothetical protein